MQEYITLDGKTFVLWYQTMAQRETLLEEYRRKKYGLMNEPPRTNAFSMM